VHARHGLAQPAAVFGLRAARPQAVEKADDCRRPAAELAQRAAVAPGDRHRTVDAVAREVLHQADEVGQVLGPDPLFVERQDVAADGGAQQIIGVLDPFGDALERGYPAQVVLIQERREVFVGDFGIDGH
jgi:hypothetical protein